jgi:hypothetical protein
MIAILTFPVSLTECPIFAVIKQWTNYSVLESCADEMREGYNDNECYKGKNEKIIFPVILDGFCPYMQTNTVLFSASMHTYRQLMCTSIPLKTEMLHIWQCIVCFNLEARTKCGSTSKHVFRRKHSICIYIIHMNKLSSGIMLLRYKYTGTPCNNP